MGPSAARAVILVVDDKPGVRAVLRALLEREGEVLEAGDGVTALEILDARRVDLVLLDIVLPGPSGHAVLATMRERGNAAPVIVISAVDTAASAVAAMKMGAVEYITKPFDAEGLVAVVRRTLAEAAGTPASVMPRRPRILVVGGDVGVRATLVVVFSEQYTVEAVRSAEEGLAAGPSDLVLIEVSIADAPNAALIYELRRRARFQLFFTTPLDFDSLQRQIGALFPHLGGLRGFSRLATKSIEHASRHYAKANVELMAEALGLSASRLSHAFREEMAGTLKEFITRVRIEAAKYLLRETDDKIDVIAERVGLYDASHLSKVFRQRAGNSPAKFRLAQRAHIGNVLEVNGNFLANRVDLVSARTL